MSKLRKFKIGDIVDCKSDTAERNGKPIEYVGRNMYGVATDLFYEFQIKRVNTPALGSK